ncbi:MAG: M48 family metallopeptidase [Spirochaetales bacterium]|nr:M48 family metallopeptidase [Spirochaetales bacterium]
MDIRNPFVIIFLVFFVASTITKLSLAFINYFHRKKHLGVIPKELEGRLDLEKMKKIDEYSNIKLIYSLCTMIISRIIILLFLCLGFYPWLVSVFNGWTQNLYFLVILFFFTDDLLDTVLSIPGDLYFHFGIEKKFGFNKMTLGLWFSDLIKDLILSFVIKAIMLIVLVFVFKTFADMWWLPIWCFMILFSLAMQVIYPQFIAPLFNKFSPLSDGELRDKLTSLLVKSGYKPDGLFVVDSSKRSTHSNAYFTGMGKAKRIVLYDTLIEKMTPDELTAVMGHEIGHRKKGHILKNMITSFVKSLVMLFLASKLLTLSSLYNGFGFVISADHINEAYYIGLFLLVIIFSPISYFFQPFSAWRSRCHEYEADRFSAELTNIPEALIEGLIKLNLDNLSNLYPAPSYVRFYASHPPLLQRIAALRKIQEEKK